MNTEANHMPDVDEISFELRVSGRWQPITQELALSLAPSSIIRCPVCQGRVRVDRAGGPNVAHFEHVVHHRGCYREEDFDGNPRPHPKAVK